MTEPVTNDAESLKSQMAALRTIMEQKDMEREARLQSEIHNLHQAHVQQFTAFQHQMAGWAQQLEATLQTQQQMLMRMAAGGKDKQNVPGRQGDTPPEQDDDSEMEDAAPAKDTPETVGETAL